jgi:hypothetical protein
MIWIFRQAIMYATLYPPWVRVLDVLLTGALIVALVIGFCVYYYFVRNREGWL